MKNVPLFGNSRINILLLIDITIIVYLSVFVSGFSSLDDAGLIEELQKGTLNFASVIPAGGITYLRPLTIFTYLVDFKLWGTNAAAFHLTNLVIHLTNVALVYHLCCIYLPYTQKRKGSSFLAALFFAIAPINSESVLWVSGRTDILCCFFFLASITILVNERLAPLLASAALFITYACSLLAKESSIALLWIVPLYQLIVANNKTKLAKISSICAVTIATSLYLFLRLGSHGTLDSGATKIVAKVANQPISELAYKSLTAFGFYIKKMIWPFPLNLAIQNINEPGYALFGVVASVLILICFFRFRVARLPLLIIVFCLGPPLLAFHGSIPWTLYAERYLYLSMTGMALLIGIIIATSQRIPQSLPFFLIIPLAISTIHRTGQWAEPVVLWHDTVNKSPQFPLAHVVYAYELIQAGRIAEAEESIKRARSMKFDNDLLRRCMTTINHEKQNNHCIDTGRIPKTND
jgi:hypothetical protein